MQGYVPIVLVSFHNIKFIAPDSVNIVCIAIVISTCSWVFVLIFVIAGQGRKIHGSIAVASHLRHIDIVFY